MLAGRAASGGNCACRKPVAVAVAPAAAGLLLLTWRQLWGQAALPLTWGQADVPLTWQQMWGRASRGCGCNLPASKPVQR